MARCFVISVVVYPNTVGCLYIAVVYVTMFGKRKPMTKVTSISDFELKINSVYYCIFEKTNHVLTALHYMFTKNEISDISDVWYLEWVSSKQIKFCICSTMHIDRKCPFTCSMDSLISTEIFLRYKTFFEIHQTVLFSNYARLTNMWDSWLWVWGKIYHGWLWPAKLYYVLKN